MRLRDIVIAISLANLFLLNMWAALQDRRQLYFRKTPPDAAEFAAVMLNVLLLAALLLGGLWLTRKIANPLVTTAARCALLVLMIPPARNMYLQFAIVSEPLGVIRALFGRPGLLVFAAAVFIAALVWNARAARLTAAFLLVMSPLLVFNITNSAWLAHTARGFADLTADRRPAAHAPASRVLVLLFDELDYHLSFVARPKPVRMPGLDRLRTEAVFARNGYPAHWETLLSIPSMLTGRRIDKAKATGGNKLILTSDNATLQFNSVPTVFSAARAAGFRTGLAGWWHPYCRVLGRVLDSCLAEPGAGITAMPQWDRPLSVAANMEYGARRQLSVIPVLHRYLKNTDITLPGHHREYLSIHARGLSLAADKTFDLVFLHYPIPHPPGIFSPEKDDFDLAAQHSYADNLPLADRTLRELRAAMEGAGAWDSTNVIVTSDHPFRANYWKEAGAGEPSGSPLVPFIIKLAHQEHGVEYMPPINNRVLHDLALDLLHGHITGQPELLEWLDARSGGPAGPEPETIVARETGAALP